MSHFRGHLLPQVSSSKMTVLQQAVRIVPLLAFKCSLCLNLEGTTCDCCFYIQQYYSRCDLFGGVAVKMGKYSKSVGWLVHLSIWTQIFEKSSDGLSCPFGTDIHGVLLSILCCVFNSHCWMVSMIHCYNLCKHCHCNLVCVPTLAFSSKHDCAQRLNNRKSDNF